MIIDTTSLKEIAAKMEPSPIKLMLTQLPDRIDRQELLLKFDLILPFLTVTNILEAKPT